VEHPLLADRQQEVEHPLQPSALRGSQSAARKSLKKNHHRPGHNNVFVIEALEGKIPEPLFLDASL
jgi:hypothetical protein